MKPITTTLVSGFFILLFVSDASAYLRICNKSSQKNVYVAIAERTTTPKCIDKGGCNVLSQGWWTIKRGTCKKPIGGKLSKATDYYYYATAANGTTTWTGSNRFCTQNKRFKFGGEGRAEPQGLKCPRGTAKKFRLMKIKTKNYTHNLTE